MVRIPDERQVQLLSSSVKKVVAGVLLAVGLSIGGYAVASAQSTPTTTPSNPSTTAPSNGSSGSHQSNPNCPNMGGNGGGPTQSQAASYSM